MVEDIAEYTGIPRSYLSKMVHKLARQGLLVARRGHHGGVVLARPSHEITLEDLSIAIDGVAWQSRCLMGLLGCSDETPCALHDFWKETLSTILARLRSVTLLDLHQHHDPGVERFRAEHGMAPVPVVTDLAPAPDQGARQEVAEEGELALKH